MRVRTSRLGFGGVSMIEPSHHRATTEPPPNHHRTSPTQASIGLVGSTEAQGELMHELRVRQTMGVSPKRKPLAPSSSRALPSVIRGRPVTPVAAAEAGVSRSRIRASDLKTPFRGVLVPNSWGGDPVSLAHAFAAKMSPQHAFSHATAAVLHGMRVPHALHLKEEIHVISNTRGRPPRDRRVIGHIGSAPTMSLGGLRVTTPLVTWCHLGQSLTLDALIIAADGLICRKDPVVTMAELQDAVEAWRGSRGYRRLVEALVHVRERTDSARETMLRLLIVRAGLPEPMINAPVRSRLGKVVAHADLAYPHYSLVIEYDGDQHRTEQKQYYIDIDRLERITREGWRVIRINRRHMGEPRSLENLVRQALVDAGWRGQLPRKEFA
jgi:very-short-patch-repair endonuclease